MAESFVWTVIAVLSAYAGGYFLGRSQGKNIGYRDGKIEAYTDALEIMIGATDELRDIEEKAELHLQEIREENKRLAAMAKKVKHENE